MAKPIPIMLAVLWLAPALATETASDEEIDAWLKLGAGWVENGNGRFGEYAYQLRSDGLFGLGGLGVGWRSDDRFGSVLAESSASAIDLEANYGRWGEYRLAFDYRQFEVTDRAGFRSVFADRDSEQTLPPDYSGIDTASAYYGNAGWRRSQGALRAERRLGAWRISAALASDNRKDSRISGASERFGDAVLLAVPVDQWHDTVALDANYGDGTWQMNLASDYSRFRNDDPFVSYENPFNPAAPPRTQDTAPDNDLLRVNADGFYALSPTRQLSWFASHAEARQDAGFAQPLVAMDATLTSLDGRRSDRDLRLAYRDQLSPAFDYRLQWDYRQRDDRTDVIELSPGAYIPRYDLQRRRLKVDAGWRLPARFRLRGGLVLSDIDRITQSGTDATDSAEQRQYWAELRLPRLAAFSATVRVERLQRDSELSAQRRAALSLAAPEQALPDYLMPVDEWRYQLRGDLPLGDDWLISAGYRYRSENFDNPYYGLQDRDSNEYDLSLSWQPVASLAFGVFVSVQDLRYQQEGLEYHPTADPAYANARWRGAVQDDSRNLGLTANWQPQATLTAKLTLNFSDDDSSNSNRWLEDADTGEAAGSGDSLPGYGSARQRANLAIHWQYRPRVAIGLDYLYERLRHNDWAWQDDFQQLGFAWQAPRYDAHALMLSVRYEVY